MKSDPFIANNRLWLGLDSLDLATLSFVQLKRLHNALQQASNDVDKESARRSEEDSDGDTVQVASPRI